MAKAQGIDVSFYQGKINWDAVKAGGIEFAFIRAGQGDKITDDKFFDNWQKSKSAGLPRGAYFFFAPDVGGVMQAQRFHSIVSSSGLGWELPPAIDVETKPGNDLNWFIKNKARIPQQVNDCVKETERLFGVKPILYTGAWFWNPVMTPPQPWYKDYILWAADYYHQQPDMPTGWDRWTFWQYSSKGAVNGITTRVDMNYFNGDSTALKQFLGNGVVLPVEEKDPPLPHMARVSAAKVNVFNSPANYANNDVGDLVSGARAMVYELKTVGADKWARISGDLWILMKFQGAQYLAWEED